MGFKPVTNVIEQEKISELTRTISLSNICINDLDESASACLYVSLRLWLEDSFQSVHPIFMKCKWVDSPDTILYYVTCC